MPFKPLFAQRLMGKVKFAAFYRTQSAANEENPERVFLKITKFLWQQQLTKKFVNNYKEITNDDIQVIFNEQ